MFCVKKITWARKEVYYCKIILWFTSNITRAKELNLHILQYSIHRQTNKTEPQNNLIMRFYLCIYILFYILISIFIITFFDVRTKWNNHIL